ncbi:histidine kinase [Kitasatospora sp. NBC_00240]|uniref:sensor histidine kinase n=1 Tax=Kitasatospora sp. NBC_00240 TaxID=2903567 RepID=UPI0022531034|nr:histidine kinase [Kitasatospora sp. NBC_00240]MCX5213772.1 histidine kinase [Kitasatospora sp. NBC_00240]
MNAGVRGIGSALLGRRPRRRWVHLVLGGALLMPYWLLSSVILGALYPGGEPLRRVALQFVAFGTALPLAAVTALLPMVRVLEGTAARVLCAGAAGELSTGPARSWAARRRTAAWYVLHLFLGGVVSGMSLSVPPAAVTLLLPFGALDHAPTWWREHQWFGGPALGLALVLLLLAANAGAGAVLARSAPALLGPTPEERLAAAEQRATVLAQRNRLARELHDSVGHALSAVGLQAAAAARVLTDDPAFAAEALRAIERTAREAVAELDSVLGLLREEESAGSAPAGPTLAVLDDLLRQLERTGVKVRASLPPGLPGLPPAVSREAYRIVQEGLTNVLRHAGAAPAVLRIELRPDRLELELTNPLAAGRSPRPGGGRGLRGIAERVTVLRGGCEAGPTPDGGHWRLAVRLPLRTAADPAPAGSPTTGSPTAGSPTTGSRTTGATP